MNLLFLRPLLVCASITSVGLCPTAHADRGMPSTAMPPPNDRGAPLIGIKLQALLPQAFSPLRTHILAELEAGYLLPFGRRVLGITGSFAFSMPATSGTDLADSRVPGGSYNYSSTEQHYLIGVTLWANMPLGRVVPYLGIGPRIYAVRTLSNGQAGDAQILETLETSTEVGVGVPVGVNVLLGPGRVFGEFQLLWAGINQKSTGAGSIGSLTIGAGYRFVL
ncbi:MAG: hypothetical protein JNM83_03665 [Myxococcales bacterium]|nr:hypothetical protein [Myxococcales bacterium]